MTAETTAHPIKRNDAFMCPPRPATASWPEAALQELMIEQVDEGALARRAPVMRELLRRVEFLLDLLRRSCRP